MIQKDINKKDADQDEPKEDELDADVLDGAFDDQGFGDEDQEIVSLPGDEDAEEDLDGGAEWIEHDDRDNW